MSKSTKQRKQAKKEQYIASVAGAPIHGEVITWSAAGPHDHKTVVQSLQDCGLDPTIAREFLARHAFSRACRKLSEERLIDLFKEQDNDLHFQFTKKFFEQEQVTFVKETMVVLNKTTGVVSCENPTIKELAQKALDQAMQERTTSDITRIVQKLFDRHADMIPIRDQGGAYFVPQLYTEFTGRIEAFLGKLGGHINRLPIAAGTAHGDKSVQETVTTYMAALVQDHETAVAGFGLDSRRDVLERAAEKIKSSRVKLEAYASYLGDQQKALLENIEATNGKLVSRIEEISKLQSEATTNGKPRIASLGTDTFGCRLGSQAAQINAAFSQAKTIDEVANLTNLNRSRIQSHLAGMRKHSHVTREGDKFILSQSEEAKSDSNTGAKL